MFNNIQKAIVLGVGILTGGLFQSASADYSVDILGAGDDVGGNSAYGPSGYRHYSQIKSQWQILSKRALQ